MKLPQTGGCICGAIRYEITRERSKFMPAIAPTVSPSPVARSLSLLVAGFSSVRIRLKPAEMADCSDIISTGEKYVLIANRNGKMRASVMCIEGN